MSSSDSGSGVRCSGDGGWCPALASVQSSQQSEPECEGREVPCSQPRVPGSLLSSQWPVSVRAPPLTGPVWPPSPPSTLGAGARAGAGLNWPLCPLRWTQIRGPAQRKDRQYNDVGVEDNNQKYLASSSVRGRKYN